MCAVKLVKFKNNIFSSNVVIYNSGNKLSPIQNFPKRFCREDQGVKAFFAIDKMVFILISCHFLVLYSSSIVFYFIVFV